MIIVFVSRVVKTGLYSDICSVLFGYGSSRRELTKYWYSLLAPNTGTVFGILFCFRYSCCGRQSPSRSGAPIRMPIQSPLNINLFRSWLFSHGTLSVSFIHLRYLKHLRNMASCMVCHQHQALGADFYR